MGDLAVYVHTPFCPSKCPYCDFNSYARPEEEHELFTRACEVEIRRSRTRGARVGSVFFGGGTPTFLSVARLARLFSALSETFDIATDAEVTAEANPGTVDAARFTALRTMGFNRISIGAQSFHDDELRALGRVHSSGDIGRAVEAARRAGFLNLSLDLMYALPGQTLERWRESVRAALSFEPQHLSLYCLTIEPGTRFATLARRGLLRLPKEDVQIAMQEEAEDLCAGAALTRYEISNYARPGFECRHNLAYWRCEQYAGYGPGAVGRLGLPQGPTRYTNLKHPRAYAEAVERGERLWCESEALTEENLRMEKILLGLRLDEGLDSQGLDLSEEALRSLEERTWIRRTEGQIQLTRAGKHFCNEVALALC